MSAIDGRKIEVLETGIKGRGKAVLAMVKFLDNGETRKVDVRQIAAAPVFMKPHFSFAPFSWKA